MLSTTGGLEPTAAEQYMLQLINRARQDPQAEVQRLLDQARTDPAVRAMVRGWDLDAFARVLGRKLSLPPLAFNTRLIEAARDHNETMLAANDQRHTPAGYLVDGQVATADDGQPYYDPGGGAWSAGENIFAFSGNVDAAGLADYVDYYHAGLMIDWGVPDFSHLQNVMAPGPGTAAAGGHRPYNEIGIGLLTDARPVAPPPSQPANPANRGLNVGPVILTQEFAYRAGAAFLAGAFYEDRDGDRFYSIGEGVGAVTVRAVGTHGEGVFETRSWSSGGYSLSLPPGTYNVVATGAGLGERTTVVTVGADNVGWDVRVDTTPPPAVSAPSVPLAPSAPQPASSATSRRAQLLARRKPAPRRPVVRKVPSQAAKPRAVAAPKVHLSIPAAQRSTLR